MALAKAVKTHAALRDILGEEDTMVKALAAAEAAARAEVVAAKPPQRVNNAETYVARKRTQLETAQKAVDAMRAKLDSHSLIGGCE